MGCCLGCCQRCSCCKEADEAERTERDIARKEQGDAEKGERARQVATGSSLRCSPPKHAAVLTVPGMDENWDKCKM